MLRAAVLVVLSAGGVVLRLGTALTTVVAHILPSVLGGVVVLPVGVSAWAVAGSVVENLATVFAILLPITPIPAGVRAPMGCT